MLGTQKTLFSSHKAFKKLLNARLKSQSSQIDELTKLGYCAGTIKAGFRLISFSSHFDSTFVSEFQHLLS